MKRPAPPRLRSTRPGARPLERPAAPPLQEAAPTSPVPGRPAGRRAVLLAGAAVAVTVPVVAGALLRKNDAVPSAASAQGATAGTDGPFADVAADDPGAEAMSWADETGVQPAVSRTAYSPAAAVTRGEVAVALHRFAGAPAVPVDAAPALIADLGDDPAQAAALLWLHGRGALWGDAELRVRPGDPASRDSAATMLAALVRPALAGAGVTWDASAAALPQDPDPGSALPDVAWLQAAGMTPPARTLADWAGEETVTRADLAVAMHRANTVITAALG